MKQGEYLGEPPWLPHSYLSQHLFYPLLLPAPFAGNIPAIPSGSFPSIFWGSLVVSYSIHPALSPQPQVPPEGQVAGAVVAVWPLQDVALPGPKPSLAFQVSSSSLVKRSVGYTRAWFRPEGKQGKMGQLQGNGRSKKAVSLTSSCTSFPLNSHGFSPSGQEFPLLPSGCLLSCISLSPVSLLVCFSLGWTLNQRW